MLGAGILLGSGLLVRLNDAQLARAQGTFDTLSHEAVSTSAVLQVLVGVGALVLGILSVIGMQPLTLNLVAQLAVGAAIFVSGTAITGRMFSALSARSQPSP